MPSYRISAQLSGIGMGRIELPGFDYAFTVDLIPTLVGGPGPAGPGVPVGGTTGQVLTKTSGADYATAWQDVSGGGSATWGGITGTLSAQTDLQAALDGKSDTGHTHAAATTSVAGFMSSADKTKLDGVATGATANSSDATLLARANHTGTQAASTISDLSEAVDDRVASLLVAGSNITLTYNDAGNSLTIAAAGGGSGATSGTATLDFGAAPGSQEATLAVTGQSGILSGSPIRVWIQGDSSADHNAYEHSRILAGRVGLAVESVTAGVGFTIVAASELQLTGQVAVRWQWG